MKFTFTHVCCVVLFSYPLSSTSQPFAERSLSNLTSTFINVHLVPKLTNTLSLGTPKTAWKNLYTHAVTFADGSVQTKALAPYIAGNGINISGNVISNTGAVSPWIINGSSLYCNNTNIGIGLDNPLARLEVAGGDAKINGLTIGLGNSGVTSNIAVGQHALYSNISGFSNTAYGMNALYWNNTGYDNAAIGENALFSNVDGLQNTAMGNGTLYYNVSGYGNTATGNGALLNNGAVPNPLAGPEGSYNTASGFWALVNNSTGSYNAGFATAALNTNTTGSYNSGLGAFSDVAAEDLVNATALGANSLVNASNKIRLGDVNVTIVESAAGSWTTSDGRFKKNVKEEVVGLPFIRLLRPVIYNFDAEKFDTFLSQSLPDSIKTKRKKAMQKLNAKSSLSKIAQTGFIAQEVAEAAKKAHYNFSGIHTPENSTDNYSLSYEKLVVPLVKSVQELSQQNEELKNEIAMLKNAVALLEQQSTRDVNLSNNMLQQNTPNPATGKTIIQYSMPAGKIRSGQIIITDLQGKNIKQISIVASSGIVEVDTHGMAPGTYQYTLYADGVIRETRKMIVAR